MINILMFSILSATLNYTVDWTNASMVSRKVENFVNAPVIIFVSDFDEQSAEKFASDMQIAVNSGESIIPIVISSYGGSIYALLEMIDVVLASKIPVATICLGKCMSCGAILLAMGTEGYRFASPNSTILIHDASSSFQGKLNNLLIEADELIRLNGLIFGLLAKQCHMSEDYFLKLLDGKGHIDLYLTPTQAKQYGIINYVRVPNITVKVSTQMALE